VVAIKMCYLLRCEGIEDEAYMSIIPLVILILLLIGLLPAWPYSSGWGYYPSGGIGLILLIVIVLAVTGRI
jgi:hypothetical protein